MRRAAIAVAALAAILVLAACGGGDDDGGSNPTSAEDVVLELRAAGLPIGEYVVYDEQTDPNDLLGRPGQYTGKANFHDERLEFDEDFDTSSGGAVEVFADREDAQVRKDYVDAISQAGPMFVQYSYLQGTVLLRVAGDITPTDAAAYESAFLAMDLE